MAGLKPKWGVIRSLFGLSEGLSSVGRSRFLGQAIGGYKDKARLASQLRLPFAKCYSTTLLRTGKRLKEEKASEVEKWNREVDQFSIESESKPVPVFGKNEYTSRTHTCGQLTAENVGERVTLCGWMTFKRLNGTFMVLRDLYGVTQVYIPREIEDDVAKAMNAPLESVLRVTGKVALRPENQRRTGQVSGDVEIVAEGIEVLSVPSTLRLAYNDLDRADEDLCIQYRYLYLRNPKAQSILRNKATFIANVRRFMDTNYFIDVETPTLIRRTQGGAREFPVLTKFKNSFYGLAQSPQIFKQLLMVGGIDKYYQIARCYRDETGRPDRQPEFSQLDIEMSFTTREGVMKLVEDLLKFSCPKSIIPDPSEPFPVMTYKQCMEQHGSDKPNTGGFLWVVDFPLFVRNENTGRLEAAHHPFTMAQNVQDVYSDPENAVSQSYDLVYCGAEVGGGSIRIHDIKLQKYVLETVLKLPLAETSYLLEALDSGCPPHGGFALGIDRFLCKIFGTKSIRDIIAFPKTGEGKDLLTGAPAHLSQETKKYYNL